jgi:hypothetical protein
MNAATLVKGTQNPRGEDRLRSEEMTAISVIRSPNRTLFKVRWRGGERIVSPEEFEEILQDQIMRIEDLLSVDITVKEKVR